VYVLETQGSTPAADSRTQGHFRGPSPQDVTLRDVVQALVRIEAYMLAVAIPAVDLAVGCEGGSECVGVCCLAFAPSLTWLPCILPKHKWFSVHMCALFQSERSDITQ
jgi:hypothetical protein